MKGKEKKKITQFTSHIPIVPCQNKYKKAFKPPTCPIFFYSPTFIRCLNGFNSQ